MAKTETLDERAARVAAEATDVQARLEQREQERWQRQAEHEQRFDLESVEAFDAAALDQDVTDARAALNTAIREHPLTQVLVHYVFVQTRRRVCWSEHLSTLGRLGRPNDGQLPAPADALHLDELIGGIAEQLAHDMHEDEQQQAATRRTEETTP